MTDTLPVFPTVLDILTSARAILAEPSSWTQGVYARDKNNELTDPDDDDATCFCLWGALKAAASRFPVAPPWQVQVDAYNAFGIPDIPEFNDAASTTHADVLNVLDEAIARNA